MAHAELIAIDLARLDCVLCCLVDWYGVGDGGDEGKEGESELHDDQVYWLVGNPGEFICNDLLFWN